MDLKKFALLSGFIILVTVTTFIAFAEEPVAAPEAPAAAPVEQTAAPKGENETQWAWGEVTNLDAQAKTLTLKCLDYETDQEKNIVLTVDEKTGFENIKSFDEIKINDTLSIDYTVGSDGKNIAKNINFEKPDSSPAAPASAVEAQPASQPVEAAGSSAPAAPPAPAVQESQVQQ
ncbi:MAG: hypothetical protein PHP73_00380 [Candidatus Omnitrophica bacterium]|nr:hypothetical protein [Candidatus Omnitrophota bacterium]